MSEPRLCRFRRWCKSEADYRIARARRLIGRTIYWDEYLCEAHMTRREEHAVKLTRPKRRMGPSPYGRKVLDELERAKRLTPYTPRDVRA